MFYASRRSTERRISHLTAVFWEMSDRHVELCIFFSYTKALGGCAAPVNLCVSAVGSKFRRVIDIVVRCIGGVALVKKARKIFIGLFALYGSLGDP